ncbi:MATE efflux family protein [Microdochium trichocladiopsis]|uniref:MATE efflux family protein n=1 Tax=Microdochium trichocladiopsis TaxID=1682393 RepID=A0A9P8Y073_9PEZI|nr:MATE efflux family protein [Microdochium trichocladiopsis]KAH7026328.1 MATE efflux family protein [Microdochium trichocladiopsis]
MSNMAQPSSRRGSLAETAPLLHGQDTPPPAQTAPPDLPITEVELKEADNSWKAELWLLTSYSVPLIGTYLLQYSFFVVTIFVAGHLGSDELASAALGLTTMNIVGFATYEGMATALDTFCAQAYGSGNHKGVGLHVQRMLFLMGLALVPISAVWALSPWLLAPFVKQEHLALQAGAFLRISIIGLPGYASFEALKRFLQAQGSFHAALVVLLVCAPLNAVLSWLLAFHAGLGLEGAALGQALTNCLRSLFLVAYIVSPWGAWSHGCWGGFSRDALTNLGPMIRLSVAGSLVNVGEWAAFEIVNISASYLSTDHLAAQSILCTISIISWHVPFSVSVAVSTRIGHAIGAGLVGVARRASVLYAAVFVALGLANGLVIFSLRRPLAEFFSDDPHVRDIASRTMLSVAAFQLIDAVINCTNGLLRGLGRQQFAAGVVFAVNYLGAVPLALWLELGSGNTTIGPRLELSGAWIGLGCGMCLTAVVETVYLKTMNWQACVESAKRREGVEGW